MKPRLLVVELHHLGDAVMSLPFVRGAGEKFEVHVLCRPSAAALYRLLAEPPQIHTWEPPWTTAADCGALASVRAAQAEGRRLSPLAFDTAVCVWADARAALLMSATGAKKRLGFPMTRENYYAPGLPWRAKRLWAGRILEKWWALSHPGQSLLTAWLHRAGANQPHLRCWEQLAEAVGVAHDCAVPWIKTPASGEVEALRTRGKLLLAVHAEARLPSKQWPVANWEALLQSDQLRRRFDAFQMSPGAEARRFGAAPLIVTPDLASLASSLASSDALLCHDSLPGHLAAALGKPVVTIFGSGEPDWFAPWNNRERAVQRRVCPMHPCIDRCGMDSYLCLDAVGVDDVLHEVMKLSVAP